MQHFDFDREIDRRGSGAMKTDSLVENFGCDGLEPLWIADMDFAVHPAITQALAQRIEHPVYGYTRVPDSYWLSIMAWLKSRHGWEVERQWLSFIPGVVKGIGFIINYFTRPTDKIIIQPPVYHPFRRLIADNGRTPIENPLIETNGTYRMDLAGLKQLMANEKPAMMILCNPHNPAGLQWDADTLRQVAAMARKYGVTVVSDEIHGDLVQPPMRHYPYPTVSPDAEATGITLGAPSKTFNIPGLVSSWIAIPNPELREGFYNWLSVNEFNEPTFLATLATEAAYTHGAEWLDQAMGYIRLNAQALTDYCTAHIPQIKVWQPQASFLAWLDCRALGMDADALAHFFTHRARMALNRGDMFGTGGEGFMRLNLAMPRQRLLKVMEQLAEAVNAIR